MRVLGWVRMTLALPCAACAVIAGIQQPGDAPDTGAEAGTVEGSTTEDAPFGMDGPAEADAMRDAGSGADARSAADAGSDAGDATSGDGTVSEASLEGGGPADASMDAAALWCSQFSVGQTGFCDDFDDKQAVTDLWSFVDPLGDASSAAFSTNHVSPPYSANVGLAAGTTGCNQIWMWRSVPDAVGLHVHSEAEVYVQGTSTGNFWGLALAGGDCALALTMDPQNSFVWESENGGAANAFHYLTLAIPEGTWNKVALDVDLSQNPPTVTFTLDDEYTPPPFPIESACAGEGGVGTQLGFICYGGDASAPPVQTYFDNVLTEMQ